MGWLLFLCACAPGLLCAQTNDPRVDVQPVGGSAAVGESFAFSVVSGGTSPFAYRWYLNNSPMSTATNSVLLLTNLATGDAGGYFAVVTNAAGSVTSSVVNLFVVTTAPRVIWVKDVTQPGSNIANVPFVLNANGRENSIQFSLRFDTNAFSAPTYEWAAGNTATIVSSNVALGEIGFTVSRPDPEMFQAGEQTLGSVRFNLLGTNATPQLEGGLAFTSHPVPIQAVDTNSLVMLLTASVVAQVQVAPVQPELNDKTGLFEQLVSLANPSATTFVNLPVYVPSLGLDTSSNEMSLYNASGLASVDLDGDGVLEAAAYFTVSNLPPGTIQVFTNGYYVTDHATSPMADYYVGIGGTPGVPMPATLVPLRISREGFEGTNFAIEWPTRPNRTYSVNFAEKLPDLSDPVLGTTSTNTVIGTGSPAHWVDGDPAEASRFYQVIESQ